MLIEEIIQLKKEIEKRIEGLKSEVEFYEMVNLPEYANYLAGKKDAYERIKARLNQTLKKVEK
jgi:glutathionyl-hydroquinone reductase